MSGGGNDIAIDSSHELITCQDGGLFHLQITCFCLVFDSLVSEAVAEGNHALVVQVCPAQK